MSGCARAGGRAEVPLGLDGARPTRRSIYRRRCRSDNRSRGRSGCWSRRRGRSRSGLCRWLCRGRLCCRCRNWSGCHGGWGCGVNGGSGNRFRNRSGRVDGSDRLPRRGINGLRCRCALGRSRTARNAGFLGVSRELEACDNSHKSQERCGTNKSPCPRGGVDALSHRFHHPRCRGSRKSHPKNRHRHHRRFQGLTALLPNRRLFRQRERLWVALPPAQRVASWGGMECLPSRPTKPKEE